MNGDQMTKLLPKFALLTNEKKTRPNRDSDSFLKSVSVNKEQTTGS